MMIDEILKEYNQHKTSLTLLKALGLENTDIAKTGLSKERIAGIIPATRDYISFWREYPDLFVDYLLTMGNPQNFNFFFYQRVKQKGPFTR